MAILVTDEAANGILMFHLQRNAGVFITFGKNAGPETFLDIFGLGGAALLLGDFFCFNLNHKDTLFPVLDETNVGYNSVYETGFYIFGAFIAFVRDCFQAFVLHIIFGHFCREQELVHAVWIVGGIEAKIIWVSVSVAVWML